MASALFQAAGENGSPEAPALASLPAASPVVCVVPEPSLGEASSPLLGKMRTHLAERHPRE